MREFVDYLHVLVRAIAWCWASGRANFASGIIFLSAAKIFKTIALFLPIKILLVLATGGSSRYIQMIPLDPDVVLITLVSAMPLFYAMSVLCASGHRHTVEAAFPGEPAMLDMPSKGKKFTSLYENCIETVSNATIILVGVSAALLVSWILGFAILILIVGITLFAVIVLMSNPYRHVSWGKLRSTQIMEYVNVLAFFLSFLIIAALVMVGQLEVYGAVLSLLMTRLMFRSVQTILSLAHRNMKGYSSFTFSGVNAQTYHT